jgi:D-serine deaminase-like pyridoxal phosphate-dependent protein
LVTLSAWMSGHLEILRSGDFSPHLTRAYYRYAMAMQKFMLTEFPWDDRYRLSCEEDVVTPALVIYSGIVASNIASTLRLLDNDPNRWRPHIKTAKLGYTLRMLFDRGIRSVKCATTLELMTACREGAGDVLLAYPVMGANAARVREIADQFPEVCISVLAENEDQVHQWQGSSVGIFLDINPGMNRTGIEQSRSERVVSIAQAVGNAGLEFRGLHYYDGQYGAHGQSERTAATHAGYDQLLKLVSEIERKVTRVREIVTAGTPTFPCSLSYKGFRSQEFVHRVSPGTIVYNDATSLDQLPGEYGYAPAAVVVTRVVSQPHEAMLTCDAGHKAVSADAGMPTCIVVGHPELTSLSPSEEHLPMKSSSGVTPRIGEMLYLLPRHVCPTVNNFDRALVVRDRRIESIEKVSARGHEGPLLHKHESSASRTRKAVADRI